MKTTPEKRRPECRPRTLTASLAALPPLLTARQVCELVNIDKRSLYRLLSAGHFPKPVRLPGSTRTRWRLDHLMAWIDGLQN